LRAGRLTVLRQWIRQGANQYLEITLRQAARLEKRSSCRGVRAALVPSGLHYAKLFAALRKSNYRIRLTVCRVDEQRDQFGLRHEVVQELQSLFGQDRRDHPNAGNVGAGFVEAGDPRRRGDRVM
jgi:hypothetical protein